MQYPDTSASIFACAALLAFTVEALFAKYVIDYRWLGLLRLNAWRNMVGLPVYLLIFLFWEVQESPPFQLDKLDYVNLGLASVCYVASNLLYLVSLNGLDLSVFGALFNLRLAFSALLAAAFAGETLGAFEITAIFFILLGSLGANYRPFGKTFLKLDLNFAAAIGCMTCLALMGLFIKKAALTSPQHIITIGLLSASFLFALLSWPFTKAKALNLPARQTNRGVWRISVFAMAICGLLGTVLVNFAYAHNVAITAAIISVPLASFAAIGLSVLRPGSLEAHPRRVYLIRGSSALVAAIAAASLTLL
jgi:drug/metabolite transporter (DMT)-like permease